MGSCLRLCGSIYTLVCNLVEPGGCNSGHESVILISLGSDEYYFLGILWYPI